MKKTSTYTEQVMKLEVTFIGDCAKTAEEIKMALGADHVLIKSTKVFEHESKGYLFLNEVYDMLGITRTRAGVD